VKKPPNTLFQRTLTRGGLLTASRLRRGGSAVASPHHQRATDGLDWGPALGRKSLLAAGAVR